jgi:hypothetical protein
MVTSINIPVSEECGNSVIAALAGNPKGRCAQRRHNVVAIGIRRAYPAGAALFDA